MSGALSYRCDDLIASSLVASPVSIHSSAIATGGSRSCPSVDKEGMQSSCMPAIASQVTLSEVDNPELFLFRWTSFDEFFSPTFLGPQEKALRASFWKLLKLLEKDGLVGAPVRTFGFGLVPETDMRGSLDGELMLIAIAFAAYATSNVLSLNEGNSLRICQQKKQNDCSSLWAQL